MDNGKTEGELKMNCRFMYIWYDRVERVMYSTVNLLDAGNGTWARYI